MLEKKHNIFTGNVNNVINIYKIINHLELLGYNYTAFIPNKPSDAYTQYTYLETYLNGYKKNYRSIDHLNSLLIDKSNFFRTDLVILDIWNLYILDTTLLNNILNLNLKSIVLTKSIPPSLIEHKFSNLKYKDFNFFEIKGNSKNTELLNLNTKICSNIEDLIKSNIRDIKIQKLFD